MSLSLCDEGDEYTNSSFFTLKLRTKQSKENG
jgi:hypothetical protein